MQIANGDGDPIHFRFGADDGDKRYREPARLRA
jgi:hypothetical protein